MQTIDPKNAVEKMKAEKNGLDLLQEIDAFSKMPWQEIPYQLSAEF